MAKHGTKPHKDIKAINVGVPTGVWARLRVVAQVLGRPQYAIVTEALTLYFEHLAPATRHLIDGAAALRHKKP